MSRIRPVEVCLNSIWDGLYECAVCMVIINGWNCGTGRRFQYCLFWNKFFVWWPLVNSVACRSCWIREGNFRITINLLCLVQEEKALLVVGSLIGLQVRGDSAYVLICLDCLLCFSELIFLSFASVPCRFCIRSLWAMLREETVPRLTWG